MAAGAGAAGRGHVVVTGASSGIGRTCALHLDSLGFTVHAGVRRDEDAEALASEASERLSPLRIDVTDEGSIAAAEREVAAAAGDRGLAGLVNNAGVAVGGPLEFLPIEDLRRQLEINLIGQVAVTQRFLGLLRAARGRIVNMSSIGGRVATAFLGPYNASKHALEAVSDALRQELRPWGIEVAIVEPGSIATPIWEKGRSEAQRMRESLPEEGRELYGPSLDAFVRAAEQAGARGIPPQRVAEVVAHALTASRPRTRYLVGADAKVRAKAATVMPDRAMDRLVARVMGLPRRAG